jgi:hypothetical protein
MTPRQVLPSFQSFVSFLVTFLLVLPSGAVAQTPAAPPQTKVPSPQDPLKVFVLTGAGTSNFIPDRISKMVVVEVRDKNDLPLEGASVLFELPASGPGGSFSDGEHSRTVKTDLRGQAAVSFELSQDQGHFQIAVTATSGEHIGKATISQSNSLKIVADEKKREPQRWYTSKKFLIIAAVVASGAAVGIILGTRGGSSKTSSTPTIVITPGSPTFGGPQ